MQRQRDGLVPIGEALSGLGGPVKAPLARSSSQLGVPTPRDNRYGVCLPMPWSRDAIHFSPPGLEGKQASLFEQGGERI